MLEILPIFALSMMLAWFSSLLSKYDKDIYDYSNRNNFFIYILIIALVIFGGTRIDYNDTIPYIFLYNETVPINTPGFFDNFDWMIGENPGFVLVRAVMRAMSFSSQTFIFVFSAFTISVYVWFIHKYSSNITMGMFLFFTMGVFLFNLAAIKQCTSTAFALMAVDRLLEGKKVRFVLLILIGMTFHPYALMFLIAPFLTFKPFSKASWFLLGGFGVAGIAFQLILSRLVSLTVLIGEDYTVEKLSQEGVNPIRTAVYVVPIILAFFIIRKVDERFLDKKTNLIINLSMICGELMFFALFGTADFFGRLSEYFDVFYVLSIPLLIKFMDNRFKAITTISAVVLYFVYFVYSCLYQYEPYVFDQLFERISFFKYLSEGVFA